MSTIVLDDQSIELLKQCATSAVLRDSAGNIVGVFERRIYDPALIPDIDEAELDRRSRRWQGIPHAEARRMLEELR